MIPVVVCLVGYRNPNDIIACLTALAASTYAAFEVVICENGGQAARDDLLSRVPATLAGGQPVSVLPYDGNSGYAGGNNRCVASRPDAPLWWILNPDTSVTPEAMALLVAPLRDGRFDAVGGTLLQGDGRVQAYGGKWVPLLCRAVSLGKGQAYDSASMPTMPEIDYILGASLMFTSHFLEVAGPMRDDYFLYGEEVEWGLRAKARGLRLGTEPFAIIHHSQGATTGDGGDFNNKPRLPVYLDQRNKILILRDFSPALLLPGAVGALLALLARALKARAWRQLGYGLAGWAAGLANRRGPPN